MGVVLVFVVYVGHVWMDVSGRRSPLELLAVESYSHTSTCNLTFEVEK